MIINTDKLPVHIGWRITNHCDHEKCKFCYAPIGKFITDRQNGINIAMKLKELGAKRVVISGGEPLVCDYCIEIIKLLHKDNIKVNLSTNGNKLLVKFPDYYEFLSVLSIPLEGTKSIDDSIRGEGHYNRIIQILNDVQKHIGHNNFRIKLETVITDTTTINDLEHLKELCKRYNVSLWKIFELNHYPERIHSVKQTLINEDIIDWIENNREPWMVYESCEDRSRRHFIINPNGDIIIPTKNNNEDFEDIKLGNILASPQQGINDWWNECSIKKYLAHHQNIYEKIYMEQNDSYEEQLLMEGAKNAGITRIYNGTDDFAKYRMVDKKSLLGLNDYLQLAKENLIIISYGMPANIEKLKDFLIAKFNENPDFDFTFILPMLNSPATRALARAVQLGEQSRNFEDDVKNSAKRIIDIQTEVKKKNSNANFKIKYSDQIIFGSTIVIDNSIIQTETKYVGVQESKNLIIELRKNENDRSYFTTQMNGVNLTIEKAVIEDSNKETDDKKKLNEAWQIILQVYLAFLSLALVIPYYLLAKDIWKTLITTLWILIPIFTGVFSYLFSFKEAWNIIKSRKIEKYYKKYNIESVK